MQRLSENHVSHASNTTATYTIWIIFALGKSFRLMTVLASESPVGSRLGWLVHNRWGGGISTYRRYWCDPGESSFAVVGTVWLPVQACGTPYRPTILLANKGVFAMEISLARCGFSRCRRKSTGSPSKQRRACWLILHWCLGPLPSCTYTLAKLIRSWSAFALSSLRGTTGTMDFRTSSTAPRADEIYMPDRWK